MNIRILFMIGFLLEIIAETGFGFQKVIFTGFSLKNLLLLVLLLAVLTSGSKFSFLERRKRLFYSRNIHKNYILYMLSVIIATAAAYAFIDFERYDLVKVIMSIKSGILDPYLVFIIFLLYPKNKLEFEKVFKIIALVMVVLASLTIIASVLSPGLFFGLDDDAARPNGPFGEPNQTAAVLSLFLLLVIAPLVRSESFSYTRLFSGIILFGCILATGSRGGLLATVIAVAYFLFSMRKYISAGKKITIIISVIFGIIVTWLILPDSTRELIMSRLGVFDSSHIDWREASSGRTQLWTMAIQKWLESPIFGIGWLGYTTMFGVPSHNSYLEVLVSSGPLGLLFYGLVVKNILVLFSRVDQVQSLRVLVIKNGFLSGTVALFIAVFFVNLYVPWLVVWAIIGLMVGYSFSLVEDSTVKQTAAKKEERKDKRILSWKRI